MQIKEIFKKKSRFIAEAYYDYLQPNIYSDDATIGKFEKLLKEVEHETPESSHFIKAIKTTLHDLRVAKKGRSLSEVYLRAANQL